MSGVEILSDRVSIRTVEGSVERSRGSGLHNRRRLSGALRWLGGSIKGKHSQTTAILSLGKEGNIRNIHQWHARTQAGQRKRVQILHVHARIWWFLKNKQHYLNIITYSLHLQHLSKTFCSFDNCYYYFFFKIT